MGKFANQRASEILSSLRDCILKASRIPVGNSKEEKTCNSKIKELSSELDDICRRANIQLFRYKFNFDEEDIYEIFNISVAQFMYSEILHERETVLKDFREELVRKHVFQIHEPLKNLPQEVSFAPLPDHPSEVLFPPRMGDKILYAPYKKSLILNGLLSENERDELLHLSQDKSYREAVNAIYEEGKKRKEKALCIYKDRCESEAIQIMEKELISQANDWLKANKDRLREVPVFLAQGKKKGKAKEFFKKHWKWLIPTIVSAIGAIAGPIITLVK